MRAHRKNAIDWLERSNVVHSVSMWHCTGCRVRKQRVDDACSKASSSSFSSSSPSLKLAVSYQPSSTPPSGTIPSIILNPTHTPQIFQAFAQQRPASAACRCPQHLGAIEEEARSEGMGTQPPSTTSAQPELPEVIAAQPMWNRQIQQGPQHGAGRYLLISSRGSGSVPWVMGNGNDGLCSVRGPHLHDNMFIPNYF